MQIIMKYIFSVRLWENREVSFIHRQNVVLFLNQFWKNDCIGYIAEEFTTTSSPPVLLLLQLLILILIIRIVVVTLVIELLYLCCTYFSVLVENPSSVELAFVERCIVTIKQKNVVKRELRWIHTAKSKTTLLALNVWVLKGSRQSTITVST